MFDCIEAELVNIKQTWKRVAYISIRMAEYWKIQGEALQRFSHVCFTA